MQYLNLSVEYPPVFDTTFAERVRDTGTLEPMGWILFIGFVLWLMYQGYQDKKEK